MESSNSSCVTIGDIFRKFGPAYLEKFGSHMSRDQLKVVQAISRCRTTELGVTVYKCECCNKIHHVNRPCGNRHCPECQGNKAHQWKQKQLEQLLPCPYFMLTFTVPAEARSFIRSHPRECYKALMKASSATIMKLAKDPKYIGSDRLVMTAVLHTWGRDLNYHPHIHFLVAGGGVGKDGVSWLPSRSDFLIPIFAASVIFRAKFRTLMKKYGLLDKFPANAWSKAWNVNSQAVGDGRLALQYLAPYVFRVAIGNHRIKKVEDGPDGLGRVTFMVRPSGTRKYRPMTVTAEEFLRRFLQHVLPSGYQKVRHFGLAHPRAKTNWEWLSMLVTVTLNMVYVLTVSAKRVEERKKMLCPECGGELRYLGMITSETINMMKSNTS